MVSYAPTSGENDGKPGKMSERWESHRRQSSDPALLGLVRAEQLQKRLDSNPNLNERRRWIFAKSWVFPSAWISCVSSKKFEWVFFVPFLIDEHNRLCDQVRVKL